jgi:hypothetical protein
MAKAQRKTAKTSPRNAAPPRTSDAERLAALRWLAMRIEQLCIEIFVTDRDKFDEVEGALREQVRLLQRMGRPLQGIEGDDCPEGYVLCRGGLCAPMCDDFDAFAASAARPPVRKQR